MIIKNVKGASKNRTYNLDYAFGGKDTVVSWSDKDGNDTTVKLNELIELYKKSIEKENV